MAKFAKLLRIAKLGAMLQRLIEAVNSVLLMTGVRIGTYLLVVVLWIHTSGCIWYVLGKSDDTGWVNKLGQDFEDDFPLNYFLAGSWSASQMAGTQQDIHPGLNSSERSFAILHSIVSLILSAVFLSKMTSVMQGLELHKRRKSKILTAARHYCKAHKVPLELSAQVRKYVEWQQSVESTVGVAVSDKEFLQVLPLQLRRSILEASRTPSLSRSLLLAAIMYIDDLLYRSLCFDAVEAATYLPGERVFHHGVLCKYMYFIISGHSAYLRFGKVFRALVNHGQHSQLGSTEREDHGLENFKSKCWASVREGRSLAELGVWIEWVHAGDFTPITHLSLLTLDVDTFVDTLAMYPAVLQRLRSHSHAVLYYIMANDTVDDTFGSSDVYAAPAADEDHA